MLNKLGEQQAQVNQTMKKAPEGQVVHQIHRIKALRLTYTKQGIHSDWHVPCSHTLNIKNNVFPKKICIHTYSLGRALLLALLV